MKTILHIGADKCGSSSFQKSLSINKNLKNIHGELNKYAVIRNNKIIFQPKIIELSRNSLCQSLTSDNAEKIYNYSDSVRKNIINTIAKEKNNLIFSCEGWLRVNNKNYISNLIDVVNPDKSSRKLEIICFLRAPVYWINAAWWQWGIWDKNNKDFNLWLQKHIRYTDWFRYLYRYKEIAKNADILVFPFKDDINKTFFKNQGIINYKEVKKINKSLPIEVLKLYLYNRDHRPSPHESSNDFLISNLVSSSSYNYSQFPWILSQQNVKDILNTTNKQIKSLISFMDPINAQTIINDPAWWDIDYYKDMEISDPYLSNIFIEKDYLKLSSDLLLKLNKAIKILGQNNLIDEFLND
mgnify:CR=1 FL=1